MTNSELQARVRTQLDTDPAIRAAHLLVDTDTAKHEITLSGTVKAQELRDKAAKLAQDAAPGITVKNNIEAPAELAKTETPAKRTPAPEKPSKKKKR
jgi:osmotically-inducible protein OsmY